MVSTMEEDGTNNDNGANCGADVVTRDCGDSRMAFIALSERL